MFCWQAKRLESSKAQKPPRLQTFRLPSFRAPQPLQKLVAGNQRRKKPAANMLQKGVGDLSPTPLFVLMVPGAGIEPAWAKARWILSPVRLPVSPPRHYFDRCACVWSIGFIGKLPKVVNTSVCTSFIERIESFLLTADRRRPLSERPARPKPPIASR